MGDRDPRSFHPSLQVPRVHVTPCMHAVKCRSLSDDVFFGEVEEEQTCQRKKTVLTTTMLTQMPVCELTYLSPDNFFHCCNSANTRGGA